MRAALATSNADRDLTSEVAVFSAVVDANAPQLVIVDVVLGDGAKDLDGTGGDFTLKVEIGGVVFDGATQTKTVDASTTRARFQTVQLLIPANVTLAVKVTSPNGADTDVDCTATVYDASPLQPTTLNNKATVDSSGKVTLADGVAHGGTTATLSMKSVAINNSSGIGLNIISGNNNAVEIQPGTNSWGVFFDASGKGGIGIETDSAFALASPSENPISVNGSAVVLGSIAGNLSGSIGSVSTDGIDADALATDAVNEIRNAITGGAYALNTSASGSVRVVDGTGTDEISLTAGLIDGIAGTKNTLDDLNDISSSAILTTQLVESYAAQGVAPTLSQFLFMVLQELQEFANSGTTRTVKKLDQSTTAMTGTYDDASNPTSLTRAT